jgi:hypothetical protein
MKNTTLLDQLFNGCLLFFGALLLTWLFVIVPFPLSNTVVLITATVCGAGLVLLLHYLAQTYHITAIAIVLLPLFVCTAMVLALEIATFQTLWKPWTCIIVGALFTRWVLHILTKRKSPTQYS